VRAVDVGVGHDNDAVIAQLAVVIFGFANAAAQRLDQGRNFSRRKNFADLRSLNVQNLPLEREDSLVFPVSALLRGTARGIAFDDEKFRFSRITLLTVSKFSG